MEEAEKQILFIFFGSHPRTQRSVYPRALAVLRLCRGKRFVTRKEIAEALSLDLSDELHQRDIKLWLKNRNNYYQVVSPLLGQNKLRIRLLVEEKNTELGFGYRISADKSTTKLDDLKASINDRFLVR